MPDTLYESDLTSLPLVMRGKVRDVYAVGDDHLLIVASDRLSAFDVILPDAIPGKGRVLTALSNFWFDRFAGEIANHRADIALEDILTTEEVAQVASRSMVVRKLRALPVEAVARGYIIGSGWKDYQASGRVSGIALPAGLSQAEQLPEAIFTPSTKAEAGDHDEAIDYDAVVSLIGEAQARQVREATLSIYERAAAYARERGIIIADTKFEFGLDADGELVLIDEVLTPDSSRFWPEDAYAVGTSPPSFDKQYVRDYLETLDWDKTAPGPRLPDEVIENTAAKYHEAASRLMMN